MELSRDELRRRSIAGVGSQLEAFSTGHPESTAWRREGLVACVAPACPERSLFNSVHYAEPDVLLASRDELERVYAEAGVRAWTVWVPDSDRDVAQALAAAGHRLDGVPRLMAMDLEKAGKGAAPPPELEVAIGEHIDAGRLNDRAYGYEGRAFATALSRPTVPPVQWTYGIIGGEARGVVGAIEAGGDLVVTAVATAPEARGRGIAGAILSSVLGTARERGLESASLQASRAGSPLYARLGFEDLGKIELWERRSG